MTAAKTIPISEAPKAAGVQEQVLNLPVDDYLRIAPWNARKTFDPASIGELAASIKAHGIQVPLLVRFAGVEDDEGPPGIEIYQVIAGHRRLEASRLLGLAAVPCIVRDLDDDQAREIGLVDNLQREDVPALEEADAYAELQQRLGTPAAIAARVGKDVSYVARRLQLTSLAELPRKALAERLITLDHALLLARVGRAEQDENLKWALDKNAGVKTSAEDVVTARVKDRDRKASGWQSYFEPESPLELRNHIEQNVGRKLNRAPWSLEDATLIQGAAACNACPSNTKANDTLFGDLNIAAATCENGACFEAKRAAFVQIQIAKASVGVSQTPLRVSWKISATAPRQAKDGSGPNEAQTFRLGQWMDVKKGSCEHTRIAVTVDWSDAGNRGFMGSDEKVRKPGQILLVCVTPKCKAHPKTYEKPKRANGDHYDPKAEEEKREKVKQAAIAESKLRIAVASKAIESIKALPAEALRALAQDALAGANVRVCNAIIPGIDKVLTTAKVDSKEFAQAAALVSISENLEAPQWNGAEPGRKEFLAAVKRIGYDGSGAWLKPAAPKPEKKAAAKPAAKKVILSPLAKKRIADAQRKRWAQQKMAGRK
jgi:ParB/RepB/Spo0J family partition protein